MPTLTTGLDVQITEPVKAAIEAMGRSEDLRFSPNNRLLAIAGFTNNCILLLRVHLDVTPAGPAIRSDDFMVLTSDAFRKPHGMDFIDDETLVVANRHGRVVIVKLPAGEPGGRHHHLRPVRTLWGRLLRPIRVPGSVAVVHEPGGRAALLVCNNYKHVVTRHVVDPARRFKALSNSVYRRAGLIIPDGVSLSTDGQWVAISSHGTADVKLYPAAMHEDMEAAGTLVNCSYPHGIRFTSDDRYIAVADAGAPLIHVYERGETWAGEHLPIHSVRVLDDEAFARGRVNIEEGGPKGIDFDRTGQVLAVTCEEQPLEFFSLEQIVSPR